MNVVSLLLGHFHPSSKPFYLYRIESTSILLFNLTDVCHFFNLPSPLELIENQSYYRDNKQEDIYLPCSVLGSLAIKHKKFLLAELCKLKQNDYAANLSEAILNNIPQLKRNGEQASYKTTDIQLVESQVKKEPISPPPLNKTQSSNATDRMSIDTMLTHGGDSGSQLTTRRLSRTEDQPNKKQKIHILPKPIHTVSSQKTPKRQAAPPNKNMRNLTIFTPAYGGEQYNGIKSAPLNSNFRYQHHPSNKPHPLSQTTLLSPATSTATSTEFAIPPIVPSQQQPPHTAHPSSKHFPPHSPQYPSSAYGHSFPVTSGRVVMDIQPKTPTTSSIHRQQFMQPFEHLFDTIETTRNLKSTLDDQIRRSSTLLQTLQASSTTIEGLVRNQIKEVQKDMLQRMEESIDTLFKRIIVLEKKCHMEGMEIDVESTVIKRRGSSILLPPAIVKSQVEIDKNEYHGMLETLKERLDKLERQLEDP